MMQTGQIVRIFYQGAQVQIFCADERGLFSVYFELKPFYSFVKAIKSAKLKLNGLLIHFDRDTVSVPALNKAKEYSTRLK
jgi:hypothetical protein